MTNDETPNDEGMTNIKARTEFDAYSTSISECRVLGISSFELLSSFVIRHWKLVIYDKARLQSALSD